jgi:hypothetical protein
MNKEKQKTNVLEEDIEEENDGTLSMTDSKIIQNGMTEVAKS